MQKQVEIKVFVPAKALEFTKASEFLSLGAKIKSAVSRYYIKGDFFVLPEEKDKKVRIFINNQVFNKEALGYEVEARVVCG